MLAKAFSAAVNPRAGFLMAAIGVVVGEAELASVGGMRGSIAKAFTLPLASTVQLLLLLGKLSSSRIATIVGRACIAVLDSTNHLCCARIPVVALAGH